jgi:Ca2+/Na+ antiporter
MNPVAKTLLMILGGVLGIFSVPVIIILFHDYLNAFFAITLFIACFVLFVYYTFKEYLPIVRRAQLEEEQIIHRFNGDPEKIRFYRGFKKHFDGELDLEQLEKWFEHHPRKH